MGGGIFRSVKNPLRVKPMSWAGIFKAAISVIGGLAGWVVAEFKPAFPLVVVAVIFILYDTWTAYRLDRRAHAAYPKRTARH